jgi:hypothetical protein
MGEKSRHFIVMTTSDGGLLLVEPEPHHHEALLLMYHVARHMDGVECVGEMHCKFGIGPDGEQHVSRLSYYLDPDCDVEMLTGCAAIVNLMTGTVMAADLVRGWIARVRGWRNAEAIARAWKVEGYDG